jgi:hypothetical protein
MTSIPSLTAIPSPGSARPIPGGGIPPAPGNGAPRSTSLVIAAVAVTAVVLLALLLGGVFPGVTSNPSGHSGPPGTSSERSAEEVAATYAEEVAGGPWSLSDAAGIDTTVGFDLSNHTFPLGNASCPLSGTSITSVDVPGFNGTYSTGFAEAWLVAFYSAMGAGAALYLIVHSGSVGEIGEIRGGGCVPATVAEPLPSGLIDSTDAASAAVATANGSSYVAAHPRSNASYELSMVSGGVGSMAFPVWEVNFDTCSSGILSLFDASVYAANGTVWATGSSSSPAPECAGATSTPLGTEFAWAYPTNETGITETGCPATAGHFCYAIVIAGAGNGVSTSNVQLSLRSVSGAAIPWPPSITSISLVSPTGPVVATYSTTNESWVPVGSFSGLLTSGMAVVIYTTGGPGLFNDEIVATGENGYSGNVLSAAFP